MVYTKRIVCLADSRKLQGHCIAGKEIKAKGFGKWIRPVSNTKTGELSDQNLVCRGGNTVHVLDILDIPLKQHSPNIFQAENYLIDQRKKWSIGGQIGLADLPELCDQVTKLWTTGYSSAYGENDRIPMSIANRIRSSLLLIKPSQLVLSVEYEFASNKRKVRAHFLINRIRYRLVVTDLAIERRFLEYENGDYHIKSRKVYLCVSLGEPYKGFTYKLVAAVIGLNDDED